MDIAGRIELVKEKMEKAAFRSGRKPGDIRLMGVTKFHNIEKIEEAVNAGLFLFGESRVQEAAKKYPALKEKYHALELHLIGNLQRNKVKNIFGLFDGIQSVDREELIRTLGDFSGKNTLGGGDGHGAETSLLEKPLSVLLEMHTGEESKTGFPDEDALSRAAELVLSFPHLKLSGLMTMAPFTRDVKAVRQSFRKLVSAQACLQRRFPASKNAGFSCLSMGMSDDFEIAIEEGSTLVRIGTLIFGPPYSDPVIRPIGEQR